jgi:threonine aldolase
VLLCILPELLLAKTLTMRSSVRLFYLSKYVGTRKLPTGVRRNDLKSFITSRALSRVVDLRSDTVTAPCRPMLEAAMNAVTGDDVMGEDPTVLELEAYVADLFGKEKGLYVPTATMANLVAILSHCHGRASEIIIGSNSHICLWEGGNAAGMGGVHTRQLMEDEATAELHPSQIRDAIRSDNDDHFAKTELLCLENTHNMLGGVALSVEYMNSIGSLCHEHGLGLHVDGARICNTAVALGVSVQDLCRAADSVSLCLSKGLGAPLGSVVVGEMEFIRLAKRARKRCGGGMRQAGVVAAMGLYAIRNNYDRLEVDHERATRLAGMLESRGFRLPRQGKVDTNIFYFGLPESSNISTGDYCARLNTEYGIKLTGGYSRGGELFRAVTHLDLSDSDIDRAADAMIKLCFK